MHLSRFERTFPQWREIANPWPVTEFRKLETPLYQEEVLWIEEANPVWKAWIVVIDAKLNIFRLHPDPLMLRFLGCPSIVVEMFELLYYPDVVNFPFNREEKPLIFN